ncbi:MAG: HU family DNA-binding protein [Tannerella sp.]|nr:HU family DNA-binding protein [Tannerella sp.]
MNERLTTRNLADILAVQTGMEKERAEKFIDALSSYVTQSIENNKHVKVMGLGTFKIVLVRERESVHIHTGERFVIPAHHKLSFIPDKNLKDQINRPFAFFEPVEATEDVFSLSQKNRPAGDEAESDAGQETEELPVFYNEDEDSDELPVESEAFQPVSEEVVIPVYESEPETEEFPFVTENSRYVSDEYLFGEGDDIPPLSEGLPDDTRTVDYEFENSTAASYRRGDGDDTALLNANVADEYRKKSKTKMVAPLWLWFLLLPFLIVAGVAIAMYAFLHYNAGISYHDAASPTEDIAVVEPYDTDATMPRPIGATREPAPDDPVTGPDDEATFAQSDGGAPVAVAVDSVGKSDTANAEPEKEKRVIDWLAPSPETANTEQGQGQAGKPTATAAPEPKQTGQRSSGRAAGAEANKPQTAPAEKEKVIPARVRMAAGSSLTQIAMEHYGDKIFWVYIYEYNKSRIKDFNRIPVGTEIRLPQPKTYGINAKSKTSVQKARQKQSELLKWDKWDDYQ